MALLSPRPAAPSRRAGDLPDASPARALRELGLLTWLPVGALAAVLALSVLAPGAARSAALPLAVVGAVLGIPHGAVDHLVPWWWSARPGAQGRRRQIVLFAAGYAVAAAAALAVSLLAPAVTFAAFLLLSALHFGRGEVAAWAERGGRPVPSLGGSITTSLAPGLVVVGLMLWSPRADVGLLAPIAPGLAGAADRLQVVGLTATALVTVAAALSLLRDRRLLDAGELALLLATFWLAPPLAAFGVYFGCWHAVRHTGRLLDLARQQDVDAGWSRALRRLLVAGSWPTAVALLGVLGLWALHGRTSLQAEVGVLLALTFPHAAVVWTLDRRAARTGQLR
ncbi:MAG TPA: Brp/Blh family beta-carotene 15,15'-dioxygenase [Motilibacteraceae bacterium]|nr:Brp/Blh family beta-carotene 15,15'-dioxygenase [Motilibacteraceae bacterium]